MRISPKQYAQVLYDLVSKDEKQKIEAVINDFVKLLIAHNAVSQYGKIIYFFEKIWAEEKGIKDCQVISAYPLGRQIKTRLEEYFKKLASGKIEFQEEVDSTLKGGMIIRYEGKSLDYSLQGRLRQLKSKLI